jgi:hypothetical protein
VAGNEPWAGERPRRCRATNTFSAPSRRDMRGVCVCQDLDEKHLRAEAQNFGRLKLEGPHRTSVSSSVAEGIRHVPTSSLDELAPWPASAPEAASVSAVAVIRAVITTGLPRTQRPAAHEARPAAP